ncbi:hypothetical protein CROQUDRAFT_93505 [Cronartium quercuum f. sp. fusiforme G11]|uniref:Uncharacterized protein n=1 Tax=Cronartium quercuum f. sp. fusiforme G11 TaxID=708437 RepID=A0A9P6NLJ6_9BASI|nr:hypothetical protein CROQUDRAFT_93505 [Cronartium quercuum f. sp. fusiforme G11]
MRRSSYGGFKKHARFVSCQAKTEGFCGISENYALYQSLLAGIRVRTGRKMPTYEPKLGFSFVSRCQSPAKNSFPGYLPSEYTADYSLCSECVLGRRGRCTPPSLSPLVSFRSGGPSSEGGATGLPSGGRAL